MIKIVNESSFTIGRSMDCTIPLTEDSISRVHIVVHRRQDQIWIEDKGSSNGTFVNNVRIAQNSLVNVVANDRIRVGKSDYIVSIALEVVEKEDGSPKTVGNAEETELLSAKQALQPTLMPKDKAAIKSEQRPERLEPKQEAKAKNEAPEYNNDHPQFEGERIIHEAHKKAAQIIYDGEVQAEKRVQAIHIEARDRQAQAEIFYKKKIYEAHKEADNILITFQKQGQELLEQARQLAHEIRDEIDLFSQNLREKARKEAEEISDEARQEAELLKQEAYEKARSKAEIEAEDLVVSANAESQDILNFATQQAAAMLTKARTEMESELQGLKEQLEEKKKNLSIFKKEQEEFNIKALGDQEELERKILESKSEYQALFEQLEKAQRELREARTEDGNLQEKIRDQKKASAELEHQIGQLYGDTKTLERKNKELQEHLGHFSLDIQAAEEKKKMMENDLTQQKALLSERLEKESQQIINESEERIQESQLEMNKRLQKLEREMLEEIMGRKETLVKDIIVIIETRIAKVLEPAKWDLVSSQIFEGISETLEGKSVSFSENTKAPKQSASLQRKKKRDNLRWMTGGITAGIVVSFLGLHTYSRILRDKSPMRTIAAEESRKRQEDLDRRKFNPTQVTEIKDTYTDAVIYTSGFVAAYQNPVYQQKLYKAASAYLLKTWRVDEDKSIQVLSMSSALIKELNDRRQSIHPDYIKDGIAKMHALEKESLDRMKILLGSEVRLESYRRFERKFFESEILRK